MEYISTNNIEKTALQLHDALLNDIKIQYQKKKICLSLILPVDSFKRDHEEKAILLIKEMIYFRLSGNEPWGMGSYIFSIEGKIYKKEFIKITLLLNSGDKIIFCGKEIYMYTEKDREFSESVEWATLS